MGIVFLVVLCLLGAWLNRWVQRAPKEWQPRRKGIASMLVVSLINSALFPVVWIGKLGPEVLPWALGAQAGAIVVLLGLVSYHAALLVRHPTQSAGAGAVAWFGSSAAFYATVWFRTATADAIVPPGVGGWLIGGLVVAQRYALATALACMAFLIVDLALVTGCVVASIRKRERAGSVAQWVFLILSVPTVLLHIPFAAETVLSQRRLGDLREKMGKHAEACEMYAKAVKINPRDAMLYSNWGVALYSMGKAPEACEKFAKAVEINPRLAETYSNWGYALTEMGKHAEACEKCAKAVEIEPLLAVAYHHWGTALVKMGKHAEACEKCSKAVEINPRDANAYCGWGWALWGMGKTAEAFEKLEQAAALDPSLKGRVDDLRRQLTGGK